MLALSHASPSLARASLAPRLLAADDVVPPWVDVGDVPVPAWARSVAPNKRDAAIYAEPGKLDARRGSAQLGARLPLFGTRARRGCMGRWLNVGPLAWICSDVADFCARRSVCAAARLASVDVIRRRLTAFVRRAPGRRALAAARADLADATTVFRIATTSPGRDGAFGFANLAQRARRRARSGARAGLRRRDRRGEERARRALGQDEEGPLDRDARARSRARRSSSTVSSSRTASSTSRGSSPTRRASSRSEKADKATGTRVRFEKVHVREEKAPAKDGAMVRVSADDEPAAWMRARDLARPRLARRRPRRPAARATPSAGSTSTSRSRRSSPTRASKPVFATIVSTGKGRAAAPSSRRRRASSASG